MTTALLLYAVYQIKVVLRSHPELKGSQTMVCMHVSAFFGLEMCYVILSIMTLPQVY